MGDAGGGGVNFVASSVEHIEYHGGLRRIGEAPSVITERALPQSGAAVDKPLDVQKLDARAADAGGKPQQHASLYEALAAQRDSAAATASEREKMKYRPRGLDEEEVAFLEEEAATADAQELAEAEQAAADRAAFEAARL